MKYSIENKFKFLIITNTILSILITLHILIFPSLFGTTAINNLSILSLLIYGSLWFYSLYMLYIFKKTGIYIYLFLVMLGILLNLFGNTPNYTKYVSTLSTLEHLVIGSIITIIYLIIITIS